MNEVGPGLANWILNIVFSNTLCIGGSSDKIKTGAKSEGLVKNYKLSTSPVLFQSYNPWAV